MLVLIMGIASLLAPTVNGLECQYDEKGLSLRSQLTVKEYEVRGTRPEVALAMLRESYKPYQPLGRDTLGAHAAEWQVRYHLSAEEGRVIKACFHTQYVIHLPRFTDAAMARCFEDLVDAIRVHEERHHKLTKPLVDQAGRFLIGLQEDALEAKLTKLRETVNDQNQVFHDSPEGQPIILNPYYRRRCRG